MEFNNDDQKQNFIALMNTLAQISKDQSIPLNIRRMIAEALDENDERVQILPLTNKVREEHNIPLDRSSFHKVKVRREEINTYEYLSFDEESNFSTVYTEARPVSGDNNDLLGIMHELAHAKMTRFLKNNLNKLEWFTSSLVIILGTYPDMIGYINTEFDTYLGERFAMEVEVLALRSMYGKYFDIWPTCFCKSILTKSNKYF